MKKNAAGKGELFVISGPSGAGKGTIVERLIRDTEMELSVSATTRAPRPGEREGVSYYFIDRDEFRARIDAGGFLEYAEVYGNYYGTPRQNVTDKLAGGIDVVLEIDIQGAMKVKRSYPEGIFIFILPPSLAVLRERLTGRGTDSGETIELRLSKTREEIAQVGGYDYFVINDDLEEAVRRVEAIVLAEHSRVDDHKEEILEKYEEE